MRIPSVFVLTVAAALAACGNGGGEAGAPSASGKASSASSGVTSAPAPSAKPTPPPTSAPSPAPSGSSKFACGSKEDPCPMQKWMKENVGKAMKAGDKDGLTAGFKTIAEHAPPGYDQWKSIAEEGGKKVGNLDDAGAVCKKCHELYQTSYRSDMRDKAWP